MNAKEKENGYSDKLRDWVGILNRLNAAITQQRSSIRCLRERHERSTRRFRKRLQALSICRQRCITKARKQLDHKYAPKDPARVLPPEIVAEIFANSVVAQSSSSYDDLDVYHSAPWVLSRVSSLWREIVLSTPAIWSVLTVDDGEDIDEHWPLGRKELLRTFLSRSRAHPLHVTHIADFDFDFVMFLLHKNADHLASLDLSMNHINLSDRNDSGSFLLLGSAHFPVLRSLRLHAEGAFYAPTAQVSRMDELPPVNLVLPGFVTGIAMFANAPMLSEVSLDGVSLSALRLPLDRLEIFSGDITCTDDFYAVFRDGVNLRSATLTVTAAHIVPEEHPVLNTSLRHLSIMSDLESCLTLIRLPDLTSLLIDDHFRLPRANLAYTALISSATHLERLAIEFDKVNTVILRDILEACTGRLAVLSLHFETGHLASDFYRLITWNEANGPWMLPGLKHLYVRDDGSTSTANCPMPFAGEELLLMLHSRSDGAVGGVERLERLVLSAPYWTATSYIAFLDRCDSLLEFQGHGIDVQFHVGYARSVLAEEDAFAVRM